MKRIILLFIFTLLNANEAFNTGKSQATDLLNVYKKNMNERINKPMISNTPLYTTDNSQNKVVNISCGAEKPFIKVGYSGSSDINIVINGDLDFNGNYEKNWYVNNVSGVCSNGFIKCSPNSWSNCHYYEWQFNGNNITYQEVSYSELGGCYCINSSCKSLAASYKTQIENDIAGGISGVIKNNGNYIISKTNNDSNYVYIWGQSVNCDDNQVPTNVNKHNIESMTEDKQMEDMNNKDSVYYTFNRGIKNVNDNGSIDKDFKTKVANRTDENTKSANLDKTGEVKNFSYKDGGKVVNGSMQSGDINQSQYCEVEWTATDTTAYSDNTTKDDTTISATTRKSEIRECDNGICPIKKGETLKHDCGSINDFGEVTAQLQSVENATKDLTCSK
jgi:hypothetical protein